MASTDLSAELRELIGEFSNVSNHEAYELAFTKRMLRPDLDHPSEYLGNTQRKDFVVPLRKLISRLSHGAQILDVGAGSGETVELALNALAGATINLVEPNPVLINKYHEQLKLAPNLNLGFSYCGILEDFYEGSGKSVPDLSKGQDLVLNIHVIYHLTNFRSEQIEPERDLYRAVEKMYSCLNPGGSIFLVCADQLVSTSGQAGRYYFNKIGERGAAERLLRIAECRRKLLYDGEIVKLLNDKFSDRTAAIENSTTESYWYGDTVSDIAAMCLTAEMGEIDDQPFDVEKLKIAYEFVQKHPDRINLVVEDNSVPQKGMVRANQPQIISIITRRECGDPSGDKNITY